MRNSRLFWALVVVLSLVAFVHATVETPSPVLVIRQDKESNSSDGPRPTDNENEDNNNNNEDNNNEDNNNGNEDNNNENEDNSNNDETTDDPKITAKPSETNKDSEENDIKTTTGTKSKTTRIPANSPAGSIVMMTPAATDGMQYYPLKQGDPITFVWNITNVLVRPTALNIEAFCPLKQQYYTITEDHPAQKTSVVWDVEGYQATADVQLVAETYMLYIYDSSKSRTDIPKPGHLGTFSNLRFGLYEPRSPIPLSEYKCQLCSAGSFLASHEVRVLLGTSIIAALSFSWFIAGVSRLF